MKLIIAIIKPFKLDEVREALTGVGEFLFFAEEFASGGEPCFRRDDGMMFER